MSQQEDKPKVADLGRLSEELNRGLRRCSGMVRDYRSRLIAANSNDPNFMLSTPGGNDGLLQHEGED